MTALFSQWSNTYKRCLHIQVTESWGFSKQQSCKMISHTESEWMNVNWSVSAQTFIEITTNESFFLSSWMKPWLQLRCKVCFDVIGMIHVDATLWSLTGGSRCWSRCQKAPPHVLLCVVKALFHLSLFVFYTMTLILFSSNSERGLYFLEVQRAPGFY